MYINKNCFGECSSPAPGVGRIAIRVDALILRAAKKKEGNNHSISDFFIEYKVEKDSAKVCYTCDYGDVEFFDCDNVDDVIVYLRDNATLDVHKNIYTAGCFKEGEVLRSCEVDTPRKISKYYVVEMDLIDERIEDVNECPDYESAAELLCESVNITCDNYREIPGAVPFKKFMTEPRGYEHEHKEDWLKAVTKCTEGSKVTDHRVFCIVESL